MSSIESSSHIQIEITNHFVFAHDNGEAQCLLLYRIMKCSEIDNCILFVSELEEIYSRAGLCYSNIKELYEANIREAPAP